MPTEQDFAELPFLQQPGLVKFRETLWPGIGGAFILAVARA